MSGNINNRKEFLKLIHDPLLINSIDKLYKENNVVYERIDLYRDFTLTLNSLIQSTYMGDEISSNVDKQKHFNWCWNKVCNDFMVTNISFVDNKILYDYFSLFINRTFYNVPNKKESKIPEKIESVFIYLFDYNLIKKIEDIETFLDVYLRFEVSFLNKIN